jgi:hypothetical protein
MVGGISAVFVGAVFLVAAYIHWRFCARRPVTLILGPRFGSFQRGMRRTGAGDLLFYITHF